MKEKVKFWHSRAPYGEKRTSFFLNVVWLSEVMASIVYAMIAYFFDSSGQLIDENQNIEVQILLYIGSFLHLGLIFGTRKVFRDLAFRPNLGGSETTGFDQSDLSSVEVLIKNSAHFHKNLPVLGLILAGVIPLYGLIGAILAKSFVAYLPFWLLGMAALLYQRPEPIKI